MPYYIARSPAGYQWTLQSEQFLGSGNAYLSHSDMGAITPDGCRQGRWEAFVGNAWIRDASLRCVRLDALPEPPEFLLFEGAIMTRLKTPLPIGCYRLQRETHATLTMAVGADGAVRVGLCAVRRVRQWNSSPVWEHTVRPEQLLTRGNAKSYSYIAGHKTGVGLNKGFLFCRDKSSFHPCDSSEWDWWDDKNWHEDGLACRALNEFPKPPAALLLEAQGTLNPGCNECPNLMSCFGYYRLSDCLLYTSDAADE